MNFLLASMLFIISGIFHPAMHPIHVTVCNIDLNGTDNIIAIRLFADDFALALKNNYQVDIPMDKADEPMNSKIISKYVNSCIRIELNNNKIIRLEYKNSELNDDAIWIYFKAEEIKNASGLLITNTLMLDLWDDQTNLMIISLNGKEKGYSFNRKDTKIEIDLNN